MRFKGDEGLDYLELKNWWVSEVVGDIYIVMAPCQRTRAAADVSTNEYVEIWRVVKTPYWPWF